MGIFQLNQPNVIEEKKDIDTNNINNAEVNKNNEDNLDIKLEGPLSKIYSKALNLLYSKESTDTMLPITTDKQENNEAVYVYCCSDKDLDNNELINSTNSLRLALDNKKNKKVILVIESDNPTKNVGLLDNFANSLGLETIYNRKKAISKINVYIKKE